MAYDPARPRYTLPFAGKEHELLATFSLIEAVEHGMKEDVVQVTLRVMEMGAADTAKLASILITASGTRMTASEAGQAIFNEIGINSFDFISLKLHLNAFLNIALAPPKEREQKAKELGEAIGKWTAARSASPGEITSGSA